MAIDRAAERPIRSRKRTWFASGSGATRALLERMNRVHEDVFIFSGEPTPYDCLPASALGIDSSPRGKFHTRPTQVPQALAPVDPMYAAGNFLGRLGF